VLFFKFEFAFRMGWVGFQEIENYFLMLAKIKKEHPGSWILEICYGKKKSNTTENKNLARKVCIWT